jgi:hypothetical protein
LYKFGFCHSNIDSRVINHERHGNYLASGEDKTNEEYN